MQLIHKLKLYFCNDINKDCNINQCNKQIKEKDFVLFAICFVISSKSFIIKLYNDTKCENCVNHDIGKEVIVMGIVSKTVEKMTNEKVPFKVRKRLIIFIAIITALSMVTSTVAWFTVNTFAGVQIFELNISTGEDLRVSMENHGSDINLYTHVITNEMINTYLGNTVFSAACQICMSLKKPRATLTATVM